MLLVDVLRSTFIVFCSLAYRETDPHVLTYYMEEKVLMKKVTDGAEYTIHKNNEFSSKIVVVMLSLL